MYTRYPITQTEAEKYEVKELIKNMLPLPPDYMYLLEDENDWNTPHLMTEEERKAYDEKWGKTNELIRNAVNKVRMNKK